MKAKICGITNVNDGLLAAKNGAWALGFNFYPKSPRYIDMLQAKHIISQLAPSILKVGIFINTPIGIIVDALDHLGLDLAQIYEDVDLPKAYKKRSILALQTIKEDAALKDYGYILLDAPKTDDGLMGGTGRLANWHMAKKLSKSYKLILAGGLNPNNVKGAIDSVHPFAVDVASGVEKSPGIKDAKLVQRFLEVCKNDK